MMADDTVQYGMGWNGDVCLKKGRILELINNTVEASISGPEMDDPNEHKEEICGADEEETVEKFALSTVDADESTNSTLRADADPGNTTLDDYLHSNLEYSESRPPISTSDRQGQDASCWTGEVSESTTAAQALADEANNKSGICIDLPLYSGDDGQDSKMNSGSGGYVYEETAETTHDSLSRDMSEFGRDHNKIRSDSEELIILHELDNDSEDGARKDVLSTARTLIFANERVANLFDISEHSARQLLEAAAALDDYEAALFQSQRRFQIVCSHETPAIPADAISVDGHFVDVLNQKLQTCMKECESLRAVNADLCARLSLRGSSMYATASGVMSTPTSEQHKNELSTPMFCDWLLTTPKSDHTQEQPQQQPQQQQQPHEEQFQLKSVAADLCIDAVPVMEDLGSTDKPAKDRLLSSEQQAALNAKTGLPNDWIECDEDYPPPPYGMRSPVIAHLLSNWTTDSNKVRIDYWNLD
jgi:hypothetical protein